MSITKEEMNNFAFGASPKTAFSPLNTQTKLKKRQSEKILTEAEESEFPKPR